VLSVLVSVVSGVPLVRRADRRQGGAAAGRSGRGWRPARHEDCGPRTRSERRAPPGSRLAAGPARTAGSRHERRGLDQATVDLLWACCVRRADGLRALASDAGSRRRSPTRRAGDHGRGRVRALPPAARPLRSEGIDPEEAMAPFVAPSTASTTPPRPTTGSRASSRPTSAPLLDTPTPSTARSRVFRARCGDDATWCWSVLATTPVRPRAPCAEGPGGDRAFRPAVARPARRCAGACRLTALMSRRSVASERRRADRAVLSGTGTCRHLVLLTADRRTPSGWASLGRMCGQRTRRTARRFTIGRRSGGAPRPLEQWPTRTTTGSAHSPMLSALAPMTGGSCRSNSGDKRCVPATRRQRRRVALAQRPRPLLPARAPVDVASTVTPPSAQPPPRARRHREPASKATSAGCSERLRLRHRWV
jgi:hypothetical protein